jgi:hypothetical protein
MPSGQIGLMRLTNKLGILTIGTLVIACSLMPPRRQYIKEVKRQVIPKELLNSQWTLETINNKNPDCSLTMRFLDQGELTFTIQGQLFEGLKGKFFFSVSQKGHTFVPYQNFIHS